MSERKTLLSYLALLDRYLSENLQSEELVFKLKLKEEAHQPPELDLRPLRTAHFQGYKRCCINARLVLSNMMELLEEPKK